MVLVATEEEGYTYHRDGGRSGEVGGGNADGTRKHRGYFLLKGGDDDEGRRIVRGGEKRVVAGEGRERGRGRAARASEREESTRLAGRGRASCVRREFEQTKDEAADRKREITPPTHNSQSLRSDFVTHFACLLSQPVCDAKNKNDLPAFGLSVNWSN